MKFSEYLDCADKHLKGCKSLLSSYTLLLQVKEKMPKVKTNDLQVWLEVYYLSGYIIEGVTVYAAYKLNNWNKDKDIEKGYDETFTKKTNLDFYPTRSTSLFFSTRSDGLCVRSHNFQGIIKALLKNNPSFKDVPYIGDGKIDSTVERLLDEWKPKMRYEYKNNLNLDQDIVKRLIDVCDEIFRCSINI